ncbi:MAG TPA: acetolactate synthase small subunit [Candidatus Pelagibacter sp.]|jgi:acetolactate synthase-1/3 small subunit|nr:acetolactate synthase small subunit [Candidatus Pelagibacter sp.]
MIKSAYSFSTKKEKIESHIIVIWVDNEAGALARVIGLFSGRGYNIDSLAVAEVDKKKNLSRITIATSGTPQVLQQIKLQLGKLIPVHKVADFPKSKKTLLREMVLLKVVSSKTNLEKAKKICQKYKCIILDKTEKSFVFEVSALKKEVDELIKKLQTMGLASVSRTGVVAMTRGSKIFK